MCIKNRLRASGGNFPKNHGKIIYSADGGARGVAVFIFWLLLAVGGGKYGIIVI